ncbi:TetR/AcrR family transcriptional regulator [Nakamurella sp. PAMC28650]|uniref:TetR/AcrR family transcriptional regulator n=1 Tax=Nakamurella sp. PAMC28650 TaxID=2762325 RepID=UPI00164E0579|nr:TetR/AcrR family transcriptional regulator [Nakamurella sp. PAMC28650]QNK82047.1 TetR/AcrR family transcriptional regulator [Nakamurella sp. PAMC28650]
MDPRVERTREHVLNSARILLDEQGADSVTFSSVGKAARVARQTLYRHWATREQLIADVLFASSIEGHPLPVGTTPEAHLRAFLEDARDYVNSPAIASAAALLMSHATTDRGSAETLRAMVDERMRSLRSGWGLLSEDDYALIVGPIMLQMLMLRRPVTDEFIASIVDEALARREMAGREMANVPSA